jgi:hypothetical protein
MLEIKASLPKQPLQAIYQRMLIVCQQPRYAVLIAFCVYGLFAIRGGMFQGPSESNYYPYLADAFLHGQLSLRLVPPEVHDLVFFGGHYYLYWPPLPALMLVPFVGIWGVNVNDFLVTLVFGALNAGLVAQLLHAAGKHGLIALSKNKIGLLVLFFTFGTVHFVLAPLGKVWNVALVVGFFFTALAYLAAISLDGWKAFLLTGLALAAAFLTRNTLFILGIWPVYELSRRHWSKGWLYLVKSIGLFLLPILLAGASMAIYNFTRFGSPTNFGLDYHLMNSRFVDDYKLYGAFNIHYLAHNLYYHLIAYPLPLRPESIEGGGLFWLSPVFFGLFWGLYRNWRQLSTWILLLTILVAYIPMGLLMGTGWWQWGPRYSLDFTVPLLLLTALGVEGWSDLLLFVLTYISMLHYLIGVVVFSAH